LSAWLKTSSSGTKFMSLSAQPKDVQHAPKPAAKTPPAGSGFDDFEDDLPF